QVPVTVTYDGFTKEYRLDFVADDALYELKTANDFSPQHDAQALHYAMLLDLNHAKLLNFRPGKVHGRLLFNALLADNRVKIRWDERGWRSLSPQCDAVKLYLRGLLTDWGSCLETRLYEEAMVHFCGGEVQCLQRVPIVVEGAELGSHTVQS